MKIIDVQLQAQCIRHQIHSGDFFEDHDDKYLMAQAVQVVYICT